MFGVEKSRKVFRNSTKVLILSSFSLFVSFLLSANAFGARIKDIASVEGARSNFLIGFGIVVGLRGTGDIISPNLTVQTLINLLQKMGIRPDPTALRSFGIMAPRTIRPRDSAICMITAELPPYAKPGMKIDVQVAAMGDARSLRGGQLILTPLFGPDGQIWALAQGQVITGGKQVSGSTIDGGFPTAGRIPGGGTVERELQHNLNDRRFIRIFLNNSDFSTAKSVADSINSFAGVDLSYVQDARTVFVVIPEEFTGRVAEFISTIENLVVSTDSPAKVVINERTGTVVVGKNVGISEVAVAHGEIVIKVRKEPSPLPPEFATAMPQFEERKINILAPAATVDELVRELNRIGASPQDIISILQALKGAGALQAHISTE
ncbi:MAG: flagellar basal body P-ring protein FlgI [Candidatus Calescibacterium sp.]|nr:flagellar basal body P-ring protein FlgI [Candidatus Calescibacterium sp.]MCX7733969.1 flagellar basal body P-ring protein FlgI [bacterium]MDW8086432.1 flagellar basal body P-ring protein FlgI [Candidatus Calescibacterium sp.]